ncbi:MAG: iron-containing alcohol dehydrogenase [Deltaproteobacteria bacterium]|nr:iron-containing alcohol dehydrogenase [Deltaproteobacteria bacterium]
MNQAFYEISRVCNFFSPNKIILGQGTVKKVGEEAKALGGSRALIVTDPGIVSAGYAKLVEETLQAAKIEADVFDRVVPEPPARCVEEGAKRIREGRYDVVIGLGGGSPLDIAKGAAIMATNPGTIVDYAGIDQVPKAGLPKILIPTTAGTGSETSRSLVVIDERDNTKKSIASSYGIADVAILDPMLTLSMPPQVTANTGMDALVHAIESYVSATTTPFAEILAFEAISLIAHNLPLAYSKGSNLIARYNMLLAASLAGLAFASSRLGIVHGLAYVIDTEYHLPHGRANAIMLPHVMDFNKTGNLAKFGKIAEAMGEKVEGLSVYEAAGKSVEAVKNLLEAVQIPFRLSQYGIPRDHLPKLVEGGLKQARLFVPNPRDVTQEDLRWIYEKAF